MSNTVPYLAIIRHNWSDVLLMFQEVTGIAASRPMGQFAVMFSNSDIQEAEAACERLGRAVRREEATTRYGGIPVTISQGLTSIHRYRVSGEEILDVAEALLSEAKATGRDCINSRSYLLVTDSGVSFSA